MGASLARSVANGRAAGSPMHAERSTRTTHAHEGRWDRTRPLPCPTRDDTDTTPAHDTNTYALHRTPTHLLSFARVPHAAALAAWFGA